MGFTRMIRLHPKIPLPTALPGSFEVSATPQIRDSLMPNQGLPSALFPWESAQFGPSKKEPELMLENDVAHDDGPEWLESDRESYPTSTEGLMGMRAILVDDYPPFLDALAALLRGQPEVAVVGRAHNGADGLKLAAELVPDLVLVDFSMPDMDGLAVTRRLKSGSKPPKVVIITSHAENEYREMAMQAGADGYVVKSEIYQELMPQLKAFGA